MKCRHYPPTTNSHIPKNQRDTTNPTRDCQREVWIDFAKVLTMILVVVGHSAYYTIKSNYGGIDLFGENEIEESNISRFVNFTVNFIYQFHMPFFMALSGMTYAISYKPAQAISVLVRNKSKRLLIPFLMVSVFLSIPIKYISGYWANSDNVLNDIFIGQILLFGNSHLWFVVSLFIITLMFTWLIRGKYINSNSLVFWGVLLIISYVGIMLERSGQYLGISGAMKNFIYFSFGFFLLDKCRKFKPTGILYS